MLDRNCEQHSKTMDQDVRVYMLRHTFDNETITRSQVYTAKQNLHICLTATTDNVQVRRTLMRSGVLINRRYCAGPRRTVQTVFRI